MSDTIKDCDPPPDYNSIFRSNQQNNYPSIQDIDDNDYRENIKIVLLVIGTVICCALPFGSLYLISKGY